MNYDYVIVGAGSAGCVLAGRLSEDADCRVLLLEAGPRDSKREVGIPAAFSLLFRTEVDWNYSTEPEANLAGRQIYWPRGKLLGGSSSINAMMYVRGHPADYDGWERLGNEGWSYRDVLPYFKRSENNERGASPYHGAGGPLNVADLRHVSPLTRAFVEGGAEAGLPRLEDFNTEDTVGVGLTQVTQKGGRRWSTAAAYLGPARRRPNLTVLTGALATRVVTEDGRAVGVAFRQGDRETVATASREVVVSGGAVNSPQLLMLSGIGPAEHLAAKGIKVVADLPGVGRNLQDHLVVGILWRSKQPISLLAAQSPVQVIRFLLQGQGMLTSNVAEGTGFATSRAGLAAPDLQLIFAPVLFSADPEVKYEEHGFSLGVVVLQPKSAGRVELRSADPASHPAIHAGYLSDPAGEDLQTAVAGLKLVRRIVGSKAFGPFRGEELRPGAQVADDAGLEAHVRDAAGTLYHPVGTCKMGSDAMAVVDDQLRVHGLAGLRVVDASVMPVIPRGNTNAPTIMIAEKAADLIRTGSAGRG